MSTKKRDKVRGKFQARHDPTKMASEVERIKTFKTWSKTCPIRPEHLTQAGFYYVGIFDRVKCFSCGGQVEDWQKGDTAMGEHERMYPHCDMVKSTNKNNVTFENWNENNLVKAGTDEKDGQIVSDINTNSKFMTSKDLVDAICGICFPGKLTRAKHPDHTRELDRCYTFRDTWSDDFKLPSSETRWLANAGFFYDGPGDRVRCFFCSGGIEYWEEDDEPWSEHAKNFPMCEWLLEMKGKAFVDEVQNAKASEEAERMKLKENPTAPTQSSDRQKTSVLEAGQSEKDKKVTGLKLEEMMESPTVKMIKTRFDAGLVCRMLEAQLRETELDFSNSDIFIKTLETMEKKHDSTDGEPMQSNITDTQVKGMANLEITDAPRQEDSQKRSPGTESVTTKSSEYNQSSEMAGATEYHSGPENLVCRVCNNQDVSTALLPCNHEVTCFQCARVTITCPLCARPVKTYHLISDIL